MTDGEESKETTEREKMDWRFTTVRGPESGVGRRDEIEGSTRVGSQCRNVSVSDCRESTCTEEGTSGLSILVNEGPVGENL